MPKLCTRCFRTTDEDFETCPDLAVLGCPEPVEMTDDKALVVKCDLCRKVRALPIGNVMKRNKLTQLGVCQSDNCQAYIVLPAKAPNPATPPPITEAKRSGKGK